jgi:atypical dual specificity phosphatase
MTISHANETVEHVYASYLPSAECPGHTHRSHPARRSVLVAKKSIAYSLQRLTQRDTEGQMAGAERNNEMGLPGFYWLYYGALAGSGRPGGRSSSELASSFDDDLRWLAENNLRAILTLTEEPLPSETIRRFGLSTLHLPVRDLTAPTPEQFTRALEFIDQNQARGSGALVHCLMGQGRTGTILAAYLTRTGVSPENAIQRIRDICPGSIGTPEQERAVHAFAHRRDWVI